MSQLPASLDIERIRQKINGLRARLQKAQDDAWSLFRHGEREAALQQASKQNQSQAQADAPAHGSSTTQQVAGSRPLKTIKLDGRVAAI